MKHFPTGALRTTAIAGLIIAWVVVAHLGSAGDVSPALAAAVGLVPLVMAAAILIERVHGRAMKVVAGLCAIAALIAGWPLLTAHVASLYFVQHFGAQLLFGSWFGRTLLPGDTPLISQFARHVLGQELSESHARYTRRLTVAWTLFFAINLLMSVALFLLAPIEIWSYYANVLNLPLIGVMFAGDYLCRFRFLAPEERPTLAQVVRAYHATMRNPVN